MQCKIYSNDIVVDTVDSLKPEIKIGRRPKDTTLSHKIVDNTSLIYLESQSISSSHANIKLEGNNIIISDTSRNGCIVEHDGEIFQLQQSSKTFENMQGKFLIIIIKAKEIIYKIRLLYQNITQDDNTQDLSVTLVATTINEPSQKVEINLKSQKKANVAKESAKKQQIKDKKVKVQKIKKFDGDGEGNLVKETQNSEDSVIQNMLVSDGIEPSSILDEQNCSKSVSFAEQESFSDALDIEEFRKQNPKIIIPKPLENSNFSYNELLSDILVTDQYVWSTSISEQQSHILNQYSQLQDNLNPLKINFLFTNRLRSTSRFLLALTCGIPIISGEFIDISASYIKQGSHLKQAKNYLFEPKQEEIIQIDSQLPQYIEQYFENYSLTEVCRRNARQRLLISRKIIISDLAVNQRPATTLDDVYSILSFGVLLIQLNCEIKIVLPPQVDKFLKDKELKEFMLGKLSVKSYLVSGVSFHERIQASKDSEWLFLWPKEENQTCVELVAEVQDSPKIVKNGITISIFLGEDVTENFLK
ncbi:hypothetical protein SS50377_20032 [Spironucleus salmonicida]|uniref:FHA domain-containing protein n=1 Tax=Spironucleus salmonicida TaxID=348837 RepID=V6M7H5_9EUKA|nr:hypothetical protein SS50377_20032 [Spironucleus salmonicida]|eukprot:EST49399.1 hypothetical protein SS50377_10324 [Spironucleus salmonicida]